MLERKQVSLWATGRKTKSKWRTTNKHYWQWCQSITSSRASGWDFVQYTGNSRCYKTQSCGSHAHHQQERSQCLVAIAIEAKENLNIETYTALVDKGYHNGKQIEICKQASITTIVAQPEQGKSNENGTTKWLFAAQFQYNQDNRYLYLPTRRNA